MIAYCEATSTKAAQSSLMGAQKVPIGTKTLCTMPAQRSCPMCRAQLCNNHSAARGPMGSEAAKNRRCARCGYRTEGTAWPEIAA